MISATLKFAARSRRRNSDQKNKLFESGRRQTSFYFSGISESAHANFSVALIFWFFLIKSEIRPFGGQKEQLMKFKKLQLMH